MLSAGTDITKKNQTELALKRSEAQFRYVFEYSSIGKSLTLPNGETKVNQAFCDMLGYSKDELTGIKWQDSNVPI